MWLARFMAVLSVALADLAPERQALSFSDGAGAAIRVNGASIPKETLERNFKRAVGSHALDDGAEITPERIEAIRCSVLESVIQQELAWQQAQKTGVVARPQEVDCFVKEAWQWVREHDPSAPDATHAEHGEAWYREYIKRWLSGQEYLERVVSAVQVTEEEVEEFYRDHPEEFMVPEQLRVRHLLLRASTSDSEEAWQARRGILSCLLEQIRNGADFGALARAYSQDEATAANGGDVGPCSPSQLGPALGEAACALQPGEVSEVIETALGLHIIKLEERQAMGMELLESARGDIREYLMECKRSAAEEEEMRRLRDSAEIRVSIPV